MLETVLVSVGMLLIIVGLAAVAWYYNKWEEEALKRAEEERQLAKDAADEAFIRAEQERVEAILEHRDEWGDVMCHWLESRQFSLTDSRTAAIMKNFAALGQGTCIRLLQKTIAIGDSTGMVRLALGEPTDVDEEVITEKENNFRWI